MKRINVLLFLAVVCTAAPAGAKTIVGIGIAKSDDHVYPVDANPPAQVVTGAGHSRISHCAL
jgi:hypothetical protein